MVLNLWGWKMSHSNLIHGYDLDEIDEVAQEIFQVIAEQQVPSRLAIAALCRTIVMMGTDEDLDLACSMIDRIADIVEEDRYTVEEDAEDGQDENL